MFRPYTLPRWADEFIPEDPALRILGRETDFNRHYRAFRRCFGADGSEDTVDFPRTRGDVEYEWVDDPELTEVSPWEEEDVFRSEFLDNLKARYAASRRGVYNSCEAYFSPNGGGTDGPWDVPGWDLPQPPRTYSGRCKYNISNGRLCLENIRNQFSRYCDFHHFATDGDWLFSSTPQFRRSTGLPTGARDYFPYFIRWAPGLETRTAAYRAAMEDLYNIDLLQRRWDGLSGRSSTPRPRGSATSGTGRSVSSGGPELRTRHAAEIYIREIDTDNWPLYLKCSVCRRIYDDPVYFWHLETNQLCICCRGCVPSRCDNPPSYLGSTAPASWRSNFFPRRHQRQRQMTPDIYPATKINILRSLFEKHFYTMITAEAPRQICYFCQKPMVNPVVTCPDVPPMYWVLTHGATPPVGVVQHAFCAACLEAYRFKGGADYARCPFTDRCWSMMDTFPIDDGYARESQNIAGKAWEKTLEMAA